MGNSASSEENLALQKRAEARMLLIPDHIHWDDKKKRVFVEEEMKVLQAQEEERLKNVKLAEAAEEAARKEKLGEVAKVEALATHERQVNQHTADELMEAERRRRIVEEATTEEPTQGERRKVAEIISEESQRQKAILEEEERIKAAIHNAEIERMKEEERVRQIAELQALRAKEAAERAENREHVVADMEAERDRRIHEDAHYLHSVKPIPTENVMATHAASLSPYMRDSEAGAKV